MSPEKAKIFHVEDSDTEASNVKYFLEEDGHTVAVRVKTLDAALSEIPNLGEEGITTAIVDGNLVSGVSTGEDGRKVADEIRRLYGDSIKVICHSAGMYPYGDAYVQKGLTVDALVKLAKTVTEL